MRVVGDIPHKTLKITIFQTSSRFPVKFEVGNFEQTYKFRIGDAINNIKDVRRIIDEPFIQAVELQFQAMMKINHQAYDRLISDTFDEFETIV